MKKIILILVLVLNVIVSLKAQGLFNYFKYDTVLISHPKNEIVSKADLYTTALSFFKSYKKDKEIINFNSLPLYKSEVDTTRYQDGLNKLSVLSKSNGYLNATFTDENNKRYNIGVSCYDNKYIYYITSDNGVNQSEITSKISQLKKYMLYTAPTLVQEEVINTTQPQSNSTVTPSETTNCESTQCSGTTQKGEHCKRMTTNCNGRCYQH